MRWDSLFNDLEAQFSAERALERETEITERARVELAGIELADRLRGLGDGRVKVVLASGATLLGNVSHLGSEWFVLVEGLRQWLIPFPSVLSYQGLGRLALKATPRLLRPLGLAAALRVLSRDRAPVVLHLGSTAGGIELRGVIDRVARDHFDVAVLQDGEVRRAGNVAGVVTVPFSSLVALSSASGPEF
ncbi:hypothetical protein [Paenarthrobacter nitroguajacolicus]|uniref:hypothetical protein n=1 Tax=Paenarthrobacter nitroguajacolicus TaxID=211146 RepID=UPI00248C6CCC|nr:hypothetical protein [Paenarthrobacter nitroguajacolicus]MDI2035034.1 hypothetical protein [Paenarthrobacter nitroguajacolicus]